MNSRDAVINPRPGPRSPVPGSLVILVSSGKDMQAVCEQLPQDPLQTVDFMMSRICIFEGGDRRFSVVGPIIGAPYAALLFENLIAWGATSFVFFGLCGSVSPEVRIGDVVLPGGSYIQEGTSLHYGKTTGELSTCSENIFSMLQDSGKQAGLAVTEGMVWTTDAVFRETTELIRRYQKKGALGVEMETSALFTIGRYRGVAVGAILVASDELFALQWNPGFGSSRFKQQSKAVQRMIVNLCRTAPPLK